MPWCRTEIDVARTGQCTGGGTNAGADQGACARIARCCADQRATASANQRARASSFARRCSACGQCHRGSERDSKGRGFEPRYRKHPLLPCWRDAWKTPWPCPPFPRGRSVRRQVPASPGRTMADYMFPPQGEFVIPIPRAQPSTCTSPAKSLESLPLRQPTLSHGRAEISRISNTSSQMRRLLPYF